MFEQESKSRMIIVITVIILFVIFSFLGLTYVYITTDLLKSKEDLFQKYIMENINVVSQIMDFSKEEEYINIMQNENYKESTNADITYLENENDEEENYTVTTDGTINNSEGEAYVKLKANYGENDVAQIEFLKQKEMLGVRLSNIVKQFASFENKNLAYVLSSMGYDGRYFSDSLKKVDFEGDLKFTNEEIESIRKTYLPLITADLDKKHYSVSKNAYITLNNGESPQTTAYILTLNQNEVDNICKRVLNQAMNDEIILSKIDKIDQKILQAGFLEPESLKEKYVSKIQELLGKFEYMGNNDKTINIVVYVQKRKTLRTQIKMENHEILIDLGEKGIPSISVTNIEEELDKSTTKTFKIGKIIDENTANYEIEYLDDINNLQISMISEKNEQNIKNNAQINFNNNKIYNLKFDINQQITRNVQEKLPVSFNSKNNVILSNYDGDQINQLIENLEKRFIARVQNVQSNINTKSLNDILGWVNEKQQLAEQEEETNIEAKKKQFNNKFELYAGENLKQDHVKKLINVVSKNMSDYQVISGRKIAMYIQEGQENIEKANEIENAITNQNTYNIEMNYSDDGIINEITIEVYSK